MPFFGCKLLKVVIEYKGVRGMAQLVARLSGGQEAVSSSLATPTSRGFLPRLFFLVFRHGVFSFSGLTYLHLTGFLALSPLRYRFTPVAFTVRLYIPIRFFEFMPFTAPVITARLRLYYAFRLNISPAASGTSVLI